MLERRGWTRAAWLGFALLAGGCGRDDADRLARIGKLSAAQLDGATGGARAKLTRGWEAVRGSLGESTPDARVALRLRWDKRLAGLEVRVTSPAAGVVQLEGAVASPEQRDRAVELAQSTEGVEKVVDALSVAGR
jgi:osmotically-inducible protein OsmY